MREEMEVLVAQTNKDIYYSPNSTTGITEIPTIKPAIVRQCIVCSNATQSIYDFLCKECKDAIMYARQLRKYDK